MGFKFNLGFVFLFSVPSLLFADDTLIFAIDIIRHGDRTPIISIPAVNYQWKEGNGQLTAEGMRQEYNMGKEFRKSMLNSPICCQKTMNMEQCMFAPLHTIEP